MTTRRLVTELLGGTAAIFAGLTFHATAALAAETASPALLTAAAAQQATTTSDDATDQGEDESDGLNVIVVTAQHREENLQEVPISVSVVNADLLERSGVQSTVELSQVVPAVQITRSGGQAIFFVRGVGNISGAVGEEGANAIYVDGIYIGDMSSINMDFNSIDRIEVLKGPQGTLFGRNASGGLVHVITRDPGDELEVRGLMGYGNYETLRGQFYVGGPLSDTISADIALTGRHQNKGWGRNLFDGQDYMATSYFGARSKLVFRPGDLTKITLAGDIRTSEDTTTTGFPIYNGSVQPGGFTYYGDFNINSPLDGYSKVNAWGAALTIEHELDWATLTSITGTRYMRSDSQIESDLTPLDLAGVDIQASGRTFQQELRLASVTTEPLSWQFGLFYYHADSRLLGQTVTGTAVGGSGRGFVLTNRMKTNSYAAFGEVTYALTETTHVTGGLRFTHETRNLEGLQLPFNQPAGSPFIGPFTIPLTRGSVSYDRLTYRAAIRQDINDDLNVYASYNRGFKSGIFGLNSPPTNPPVQPQIIDAFEVGFKAQVLDILRLNAAAFHYKINGYQVRAAGPAAQTSLLLNATSVTSKGAEIDFELAPTRGLIIHGNAAYLHSRFGTFASYPYAVPRPATCVAGANPPWIPAGPPSGGNVQCFGPATGNRTPLSPTLAFNIGANYTADLGEGRELIASVLYSHTSKVFFDTDNRLNQPAFGILNASLEYRPTSRLGIELWANNSTDERYYILAQAATAGDSGQLAAPRTYGINVKFDLF